MHVKRARFVLVCRYLLGNIKIKIDYGIGAKTPLSPTETVSQILLAIRYNR